VSFNLANKLVINAIDACLDASLSDGRLYDCSNISYSETWSQYFDRVFLEPWREFDVGGMFVSASVVWLVGMLLFGIVIVLPVNTIRDRKRKRLSLAIEPDNEAASPN
jgi:hypothetical protein